MNKIKDIIRNIFAIIVGVIVVLLVLFGISVVFFGVGYFIGKGIDIIFNLHNDILPIILGSIVLIVGLLSNR